MFPWIGIAGASSRRAGSVEEEGPAVNLDPLGRKYALAGRPVHVPRKVWAVFLLPNSHLAQTSSAPRFPVELDRRIAFCLVNDGSGIGGGGSRAGVPRPDVALETPCAMPFVSARATPAAVAAAPPTAIPIEAEAPTALRALSRQLRTCVERDRCHSRRRAASVMQAYSPVTCPMHP